MLLFPPSPKSHDHAVGLPVEVSVKTADWPVTGAAGANWNAAVGAVLLELAEDTVSVPIALFVPYALLAVSVTVYAPADA